MKTFEEIKSELINNGMCTNIPLALKDKTWEFLKIEFKGKSIQIGDMMNSKEYGCCATIGSNQLKAYMTEEDYNDYLMSV